jgi:hypothetical protein
MHCGTVGCLSVPLFRIAPEKIRFFAASQKSYFASFLEASPARSLAMFTFLLAWWREFIGNYFTPQQRQRYASVAATGAAMVSIEHLEQRVLLAGDLVAVASTDQAVPGEPVQIEVSYLPGVTNTSSSGAGAFVDFFGGTTASAGVGIDRPIDGLITEDGIQIVGQDDGQAAIDFAGEVFYFDSIRSSQGSSPETDGLIVGVTELADGSVVYFGQSFGTGSNEPTYWFEPTAPIHPLAGGVVGQSGEVRGFTSNGMYVGTSGFVAAVYGDMETNDFQVFPGFNPNVARDITDDARYVVGASPGTGFIWQLNEFGGYNVLNTTGWDFSATGGDVPNWFGVETDGTSTYFAGEYFDLNTFSEKVGFWDSQGEYIGSYGNDFADFAIVDGHIIGAVNTLDDGMLIRMSDGASLTIEELTGSPATFPVPGRNGGLFAGEGELGLLLEDGDGAFYSVYSTNGGADEEPVIVDLFVDYDGDGEFDDGIFEVDEALFESRFSEPGTYNVTVVAMDVTGFEVGRETLTIEVAPYQLREVNGQTVLSIGANQNRGSNITVNETRGAFSIRVDRDRDFVEADRVEIFGSDRRDQVSLFGEFDAYVELFGGNDRLNAVGVNVIADLGDGNNRGFSLWGDDVSFAAGDGNDSLTSIGHTTAFIDAGAGRDSLTSMGETAFLIGGEGRDRIISQDRHSVVVTDSLVYDEQLLDDVFAELATGNPDADWLSDTLLPWVVDDEERDFGLQFGWGGLLLDGEGDRVRSFLNRPWWMRFR